MITKNELPELNNSRFKIGFGTIVCIFFAIIALLAFACSGDGDGGSSGNKIACQFSEYCNEISGSEYIRKFNGDASIAKAACESEGGIYYSSCPRGYSNRCSYDGGEDVYYYYGKDVSCDDDW